MRPSTIASRSSVRTCSVVDARSTVRSRQLSSLGEILSSLS
jgi:hypothetical protein